MQFDTSLPKTYFENMDVKLGDPRFLEGGSLREKYLSIFTPVFGLLTTLENYYSVSCVSFVKDNLTNKSAFRVIMEREPYAGLQEYTPKIDGSHLYFVK